jgi:PAS domain S-box-containing protein
MRTINQELGALIVGREESWEIGSQQQFDLCTLVNQAALALENAWLIRESSEQAQTILAFRAMTQAAPLPIIARDSDTNVQMWNPAAERIFGWSAEEVLGRPYPIVPEGKQEEFLANMERSLRGEAVVGLETLRQKKDGSPIDVSIWTAPLPDGGAMVVIADITEQKRAEKALQESEAKYHDLYDYAPDMFTSVDVATAKIIECNQTFCEVMGYTREEVIGRSIFEMYHPDSFERTKNTFRTFIAPHQMSDTQLQLRRKDGSRIDVSLRSSGVYDEHGGFLYRRTAWRDITDRKRAEEALQQSEEQVRLLLNSTGEGIYGVDLQGNCTFSNPACLRLLGYDDVSDLLGKNMHNLIHHTLIGGQPYPQEECRIYQAFREGKGTHVDDELLWCSDGTSFPAEYWSYPVRRNNEFVGSVVTFVDITDRNRAEETQLQQMRELAIVEERNRLAREIHDTLAQGLTAIIWQLNAAEQAVASGGEQASLYLERVRNLARESLQEARRSVWDLRSGPLEGRTLAHALREETERVADGREIQTSFVVSGEDRVLPSGVEAALLRICQEALTNTLKYARATQVIVTLAFGDSQVQLAVKDNGVGFDPETPKSGREDSGGFGLINMRERIHLLGGELAVQSEPGQGTLVEARLSLG